MDSNMKEFNRETADELSDKLIIQLKDMLVNTTQQFINEEITDNNNIELHEGFSILLSAHAALFADTVRYAMLNTNNKKSVLKNCEDLIQTHFKSIEKDMKNKVKSNENSNESA